MNPKDISSTYCYLTNEIAMKIYPENRSGTIDIPKENLKDEIFILFVEGYWDKRIWDPCVQRPKTSVYYPRVPKRENPEKFYSGKDPIKLLLDRKNHAQYPTNPLSIQIRKNRIIGIIDLDFEGFPLKNDGDCPNLYRDDKYKNLFVTETNDIETFFLCYGGLYIFRNYLLKGDEKERDGFICEILRIGEFLGDAFRASQYKLKFTHTDDVPLEEFCRIIQIENPCEIIQSLICSHPVNLTKDENLRREFHSAFRQIRIKKKGERKKTSPGCDRSGGKLTPELFAGCRGHTLMKVLCCFLPEEKKRDYIKRTAPGSKKENPENFLLEDIFQKFKFKNDCLVQKSSVYSSLKVWEQKSKSAFLREQKNN